MEVETHEFLEHALVECSFRFAASVVLLPV